MAITRTPETVSGPAQGKFGDYAGLDRPLIITTVDPEPGKRGAQNVAAIDAAVKVDQVVPYRLPAESKISPPMGQPPSAPPVKL